MDEDYRIHLAGICGVTTSTGRFEWVCIRHAHPGSSRGTFGWLSAQENRHWFVRRWPGSDR